MLMLCGVALVVAFLLVLIAYLFDEEKSKRNTADTSFDVSIREENIAEPIKNIGIIV